MNQGAAAAVSTGLEIFLRERTRALRGARVGLIAHAASVDSGLRGVVSLLRADPNIDLRALFGPEHGLHAGAQDMVAVTAGSDRTSGLPVYSLYGETAESLSPSPEALAGIDVLVADLQDVGSRYYTFAATVALALEAIARQGGRLLVLDRPNPIGGAALEGPGLDPAMRSFVGHIQVPVRHGLTIGELLAHHAQGMGISAALEVVPMRGWQREMSFEATGLPWVPPSPNMPTVDTARVYPGACLIEATNLSEGRGTTRPFEWIGAPFLDADAFAGALMDEALPGVIFRPHTFIPAFHKWAGRPCGAVALHVTDQRAFRPVRTGVALLAAARRLAPGQFAWRTEPYEFVSDRPAIDLLTGSPRVRETIDSGAGWQEALVGWEETERDWSRDRRGSLLY